MSKERSVIIIGGGVIGLCCAWYLSKEGYAVTVIDRDAERKESCSEKNAGMIVPSHFIPLAAPGVISQGLKWMLNRKSPFYLRPRFSPQLWKWCWYFARSANRKHVENSQELLRDLSLESRAEFLRLSEALDFPLVERGLLMLCQSEQGFHEEREVAELAVRLGIEAEICSPERITELEPGCEINAIGGVWFPADCHLDPQQFLAALRKGIIENGGVFYNDEVTDIETDADCVGSVATKKGDHLEADHYIIAGGAWSSEIAAKLGLRLPMQAGKGYSFTLKSPPALPELCSLLKEGRVAVTPMGKKLRVAGTMEICGNDLSIDPVKLEGIIQSFCRFFPEFNASDFSGLEPWAGLRPCSPDGLPYIGSVPTCSNIVVATGHSMLGLSLGPVTGKLVAGLLGEKDVDCRLAPGRFG